MLSQSDSGPLFLWVHYIDVHMPYRPPARFVHELGLKRESTKIVEDYSRGRNDLRQSIYFEAPYSEREIQATVDLYDAAIRYVDFELGRLLESWRERRHAGGAVVVITADHGESLGEHGLHFAHDFTLYDELLRVPLIVRADGLPARRIGSLVSLTDVMPSLCRLMRLECDEEDFDGRPLPLGSDDAASDRRVFAASAPARKRYDRCPWLTVPGPEGRWTMLRTADRKLIRIPQPDGERLLTFDLRADPFERSALKQTDPSLREELLAWQKALREQAPERLPPAQLGARTREALRGLGYLN